jgi:hypothetical protein
MCEETKVSGDDEESSSYDRGEYSEDINIGDGQEAIEQIVEHSSNLEESKTSSVSSSTIPSNKKKCKKCKKERNITTLDKYDGEHCKRCFDKLK